MRRKYHKLINMHRTAKENFDFEKVALIEMGKEKLS
jgi:hypothetical protein